MPLKRSKFLFSALVIGSMTPDVESFLFLSTYVTFSHTLPGVFLFCLPAGLCLYFLFHRVLQLPLFALLPEQHQAKLFPLLKSTPKQSFDAGFVLNLVSSLLLGIFSHLLWDSFTHEYGWMVLRIPVLQMTAFQTSHRVIRFYTILQHGSSVFGLFLLIVWYIYWFRKAEPQAVPPSLTLPLLVKISILVCTGIGAMLAALGYAWISALAMSDGRWWHWYIRGFVLAGMLTAFLELVVLSLGWHFIPRHAQETETPS